VRCAQLDADQDGGGERADLQLAAPARNGGQQDREREDRDLDHPPDRRDPVVEAPDRKRRRAVGLVTGSGVPELLEPDVRHERQHQHRKCGDERYAEDEPLTRAAFATA